MNAAGPSPGVNAPSDREDPAGDRSGLAPFVYHSGTVMQPVFEAAQAAPKRVVYAEGEDERVLRAAQVVVDEHLARPILVGRGAVVMQRIQDFGLRLVAGQDFELADPDSDVRVAQAVPGYYELTRRKGATPAAAELALRRNPTALAAMLVRRGDADALLCGVHGGFRGHLDVMADVIGLRDGVETLAAMNMLMLADRTLFICDTQVHFDPSPEQLAEIAVLAADAVRRFGIAPRVALLSHSSFGSEDTPSARKMRRALDLIRSLKPPFEVEGEMHGDTALSKELLDRMYPGSALTAEANLLVMPTLDAANITFNVLKASAGQGITVGPMLLGLARPAHILTPTATVRRLVNMSALASVEVTSEWSSRTATSVLSRIRVIDEVAQR